MDLKKNFPLIAGIAIPILMIILVTLSIYLPLLFSPQPRYDFLYVSGDDYSEQYRHYGVENGTLIKYETDKNHDNSRRDIRFFIYNVTAKNSTEVSFDHARQLRLDSRLKSPDGYEVAYAGSDYGLGSVMFSGYDRNGMYLKGHNASRKLNLSSSNARYYYWHDRFLGWIEGVRHE